jgi:hypothetical protein
MKHTLQTLDKPWHLLPEDIKQWVRDHHYVIRESSTGSGSTTYTGWEDEYIKQQNIAMRVGHRSDNEFN